jgi:hypothetical protein
MNRKPPMTADEARAVVADMRGVTHPKAAARMMQIALGPLGNLTDGAREVYRAAIAKATAQ